MELYQRVGPAAAHGHAAASGTLYSCPYAGCSYKTEHQQNWIQHKHHHKIRLEKRFGCDQCSYVAQNSGSVS